MGRLLYKKKKGGVQVLRGGRCRTYLQQKNMDVGQNGFVCLFVCLLLAGLGVGVGLCVDGPVRGWIYA